MLSLNNNYFSKLFKAETGISPSTYITQLKMERARFLLKNSDMKIEEIADSVGFADQFYFSRVFKKNVSLSPEKYRKAY